MPGGSLAMIATLRVSRKELAMRGTGENIVVAYADLRQSVPQPVLESAFIQVVDA